MPEICDIGYEFNAIKTFAETLPSRSLERISKLAEKHGVVIIAGLAEKRAGKLFNTAMAFDRNGSIAAKYSKVHLCTIPPIDE